MSPRPAALAFALAAACAPGTAARQEHSDVSEQLQQVSAHPDLEVSIRTGAEHWRTGEITLVVRGSGAVTVTQRMAGTTRSFEAALPGPDVDALGRALAQHHFTARRTSALPREPGDTPVHLALHRGGKPTFEVAVWDADRDTDPDLAAILTTGARLVHRVTGGALGSP